MVSLNEAGVVPLHEAGVVPLNVVVPAGMASSGSLLSSDVGFSSGVVSTVAGMLSVSLLSSDAVFSSGAYSSGIAQAQHYIIELKPVP